MKLFTATVAATFTDGTCIVVTIPDITANTPIVTLRTKAKEVLQRACASQVQTIEILSHTNQEESLH